MTRDSHRRALRCVISAFTACVMPVMAHAGVDGPSAPADHSRLVVGIAQEQAWLAAQVDASPHRAALEAAKAAFGPLPPGDVDASLPQPPTLAAQGVGAAKAWPAKSGRRYYGYLPYWTQASTTLHWKTLTQIAWFSAEVDGDGVIGATHGWGGATAKALISTAHSHDVQVTLAITLFSQSGIASAIATASKRKALVGKLVDLVLSGGGDGINIDFEGLGVADKAKMVSFISELSSTMKGALPGADVTLATPAVDWSGAWDYDALAEASDGLFIMAYGLHWSGGAPGPNLPMVSAGPWKHKTLGWVLDDYFQWGKPANKAKFIVGLPLYGHAWASSTAKPGATALAKGKSVTYENAVIAAPKQGGWLWDADAKSTWYLSKNAGDWIQTWVDDQPAMQLRVDLIDEKSVMMGCWALGYADKSPEIWTMFDAWRNGKVTPPAPDSEGTDVGGIDAGGSDAGGSDAGGSFDDSIDDDTNNDASNKDVGGNDAAIADASSDGDAGNDAAIAEDASKDGAIDDAATAEATTAEATTTDAAIADAGAADAIANATDAPALDAVAGTDTIGAPNAAFGARPSGCTIAATSAATSRTAELLLVFLAIVGLRLLRNPRLRRRETSVQ